MSLRTLFLSRLIGLHCILVALSMITRRQTTLESVTALLHDPSMIFILGLITLAAGLAMVLAHNLWSGGALVVIVTIVGLQNYLSLRRPRSHDLRTPTT
jgi:putative exporter of polyketide antibiotics